MSTVNVLSISGGKDSTALWILATREKGAEVVPVFADTGHEHQMTYEYIDYLERELGPIQRVKADFSERIAKKRVYVQEHWPRKLMADVPGRWVLEYSDYDEPDDCPDWEPSNLESEGLRFRGPQGEWKWIPTRRGMTEEEVNAVVERALSVLYPTGIPFLDLSIWKGRFPSTKARFCTQYLKIIPIMEQAYMPILEAGNKVVSWQGIRAEESPTRAKMPEWEEQPEGYTVYRPLIKWTAEEVFALHRKHGIDPNPLYKLGMGRVGCMPCVNCNKTELFEISRRFPKEIARVEEWERIVKLASKHGAATFFPTARDMPEGIRGWVDWSKTSYGGKNYDLFKAIELAETPICSSQYGLCE